MGNSNSLHSLNMHDDQYPSTWVQSMPRDMYHHRSQQAPNISMHQVKVLPDLNGGPRLRATNNGQILQAGGTISVKSNGLQRSRSVSAPHHYSQSQQSMTSFEPQFLKTRSQTQINFIPRESPTRDFGAQSKRFGSESDIREKLAAENAASKAKQGKQQHLKKRRAPDVPAHNKPLPESSVDSSRTGGARNDGVNRKLRLFKTKAETKKQADMRIPADIPRPSYFVKKSEASPDSQPQKLGGAPQKPPNGDWKRAVPKIPNFPMFRREKSFDLSLMSEMNKQREEVQQKSRQAISPPAHRRSLKMEDRKLPKIPVPPKMNEKAPERKETKAPAPKSYVRRQIQPISSPKDDFQAELLKATKRRSLAVNEESPKRELEQVSKAVQKAEDVGVVLKSPSKSKESSPMGDKIVINVMEYSLKSESTSSKQEVSSAVPKTFYFGEGEKENVDEEEIEREQMELIDRFAESFLIQGKNAAISSESALSSDSEDILELRSSTEREKGDKEISLKIRPVLPRKQFEIPRFSPAAAWRLLAAEDEKRMDDTLDWVNSVEKIHPIISETRTHPVDESEKSGEERIERIYREPGPGINTDNKSGDSGISGDAGLVERPESPRAGQRKPETWTPQQDLGEESSTDDETEESIKHHLSSYQNKQVFSLTLSRDVHTPTYSEKSDKNAFNSMQKLKLNSPDFDSPEAPVPLISDDNWFLSRSLPLERRGEPLTLPIPSFRDTLEQVPDIKPLGSHETISYLTSGKHKVYLPTKEGCSLPAIPHCLEDEIKVTKLIRNLPIRMQREHTPAPAEHTDGHKKDEEAKPVSAIKLSKSKSKFTYQSTVRQVERRKLAEKLSREAEEMEAQRLSEQEIMKRVEAEFQKKRAREKASIRHQLQLFSDDENPHAYSLPVDWNSDTRRSDPEGASPQPGNSPIGTRGASKRDYKLQNGDNFESFVDTKTPYISKLIEQKSGKLNAGKSLVEIQPYQARASFGSNHSGERRSSGFAAAAAPAYQNTFNMTPSGNQFARISSTSYDIDFDAVSPPTTMSLLYQSIDDKVFQ